MKALKFALPLALFVGLAILLGRGLSLNPKEVPSPFIGKPAPAFSVPRLDDAKATATREQFLGKVWVLNVFASWCTPCLEEHPLWVDLAKRGATPFTLVGLSYKDSREQSQRWLARHGNPYATTLWDIEGRVGLDYGVYGVPETFVIDKQGVVRYKHVGPVSPQVLREKIEPLLQKLAAS